MKKLILLLLLTISVSAQKSAFTYSWQINHGTFYAVYTNIPWNQIQVSDSPFGQISFACLQDYLEFIRVLWTYGNMQAHTRPDETDINSVRIIIETSHPFVLVINTDLTVWKLTKAQALALANQLMLQSNIIQMTTCSDTNCICTQSR